MKNLFGRIYLKLYLSFVVIFLLTLLVTALVSSSFYGMRFRHDLDDFFASQARFLRKEFLRNCDAGLHSDSCDAFFANLGEVSQLRFWVVDRKGHVLLSRPNVGGPPVTPAEIERASSGELVTQFPPHQNPHMIVPVNQNGKVSQLIVLQRSLFTRPAHSPLILSLGLAALVLGVLVLPLSLRITKPIRELHRTGQEWAEGRLQERANTAGADEIAELAAVFNTMAGNLEKMMQQRKEFFAFVSHELKSPLARIKVALEIISEKSSADQDQSRLIQGIERDLEESEKLIEQLLTLSRVEMQSLAASHQALGLPGLIDRAFLAIAPLAEAAGIRMEKQPLPEVTIRGDSDQLHRAFCNVLENAVKFSPPNTTVVVAAEVKENKVEIRVRDEGIGIDPAEASKIFEPFYRGTRSVKKEGFGLGLFIAKRVFDLHGSSISAQPRDRGTEIILELPLNL